jgi:hypothetical protein
MTELRQHAVEIAHEREGLALEAAAPALIGRGGRGWILSPSGCINANWGRKLPLAGNDAIAVLNESAIS